MTEMKRQKRININPWWDYGQAMEDAADVLIRMVDKDILLQPFIGTQMMKRMKQVIYQAKEHAVDVLTWMVDRD